MYRHHLRSLRTNHWTYRPKPQIRYIYIYIYFVGRLIQAEFANSQLAMWYVCINTHHLRSLRTNHWTDPSPKSKARTRASPFSGIVPGQ